MTLKEELKSLREYKIHRSEERISRLLEPMLRHIGSPDPELRDGLIYSTFAKWAKDDCLTDEQLQFLLTTCVGESHLFYHIGKCGDDSVFTRSFSALVIAAIMQKDRERRALPAEVVKETLEKTLLYLAREKDVRGFVKGKGWAHSIAHGADLLTSVTLHPSVSMECHEDILQAVQDCLFKKVTYVDDEDERLTFVIEALLDKRIAAAQLEQWIGKTSEKLEEYLREEGHSLDFYRTKTNVVNFFKTVYFRINLRQVRKQIEERVEYWHRTLY
ncbi:DUF2785 domain-containing protein [Bacillus sp. H-16]|uniref:DUF2785 domain-containing protein n=1 Tax=Alteribacter salitolerans TaxID=2912333 RepID=UPI001965B160|nr:DUF2785 domain-containing protein [Alteribacter salitolerans]MBM7094776.1 DUF2785 domain-containing protein [Alteribacter salitolerans]